MESRGSKYKDQDSDRHGHYGDGEKGTAKTGICTNECDTEDTLKKHVIKSAHASFETNDANTHDSKRVIASEAIDSFLYFPVYNSSPPQYKHPYEYPQFYKAHQYPPYHGRRCYNPCCSYPLPPPPIFRRKKTSTMAPFDDTTMVTANVKKMKKGNETLALKTQKQRVQSVPRRFPETHSTQNTSFSYDGRNGHPFYTFYDDPREYDYTASVASTPQRSNQSVEGSFDDSEARPYSPTMPSTKRVKTSNHATHHPPEDYPFPPRHPLYYSNRWYSEYEHPPRPYSPPPYDQHYFSPSPPPPPSYSDHYHYGCRSFETAPPVLEKSYSPPPIWYHDGRGIDGYDRRDNHDTNYIYPITTATGYYEDMYRPSPAPTSKNITELKQTVPETPASAPSTKTIPKVTPLSEPIRIDLPSKALVSPAVDKKNNDTATTFEASTPFLGLSEVDIVCGRGAPTNFHAGNDHFRGLVTKYQTQYFCAKRSEKPQIAMRVLEILKSRGSRFVRRVKGGPTTKRSSHWVEVPHKVAYEKVCQALRDGAPMIQRQMVSTATAKKKNRSIERIPIHIPDSHPLAERSVSIEEGHHKGKENGDFVV